MFDWRILVVTGILVAAILAFGRGRLTARLWEADKPRKNLRTLLVFSFGSLVVPVGILLGEGTVPGWEFWPLFLSGVVGCIGITLYQIASNLVWRVEAMEQAADFDREYAHLNIERRLEKLEQAKAAADMERQGLNESKGDS